MSVVWLEESSWSETRVLRREDFWVVLAWVCSLTDLAEERADSTRSLALRGRSD